MESTGREPEEVEEVELSGAQNEDGAVPAGGEALDEGASAAAGAGAVGDAEVDADAEGGDDVAGSVGDDTSAAVGEEVLVPVNPRKAPRYGAFIGAGVVVGIILALVLFFALPTDGSSSSLTGLIYLTILVTPFTALLGGLAAVLFERRPRK